MRTMLRGKVTLLFMSLGLLLAVPAIALADNLQDSIETGAQKKTIGTGDGNAWTNNYWVQSTGSGTSGCDIVTATEAVTFKLNVPAGVTASSDATMPDGSPKLVFDACGTSTANTESVKFTSNTPGVYNISASYVSGGGSDGDTFNESPANLELTVVAAPTVTAVSPGENAEDVAPNTDVTATFSQAMDATTGDGDPSTITTSTFKLVKDGTTIPLSALVTYNSTTNTATLNPDADLLPGTKYNATVVSGNNGVRTSTNDVTLAQDKTWSFTTLNPNTAPSVPGKPAADSGTNQGTFALTWDASTDDGKPNPPGAVTYTLQHKDADDLAFSNVATGISGNSYQFGDGPDANLDPDNPVEGEGTWTYRVRASDGSLQSVNFSPESDPVVVDRTGPTAIATFNKTTVANSGGWYKDNVTVSYNTSTDPDLPDGSPGSGVASFSNAQLFNTTGEHNYSGSATDAAGNVSQSNSGNSGTVKVDASFPVVSYLNANNLAVNDDFSDSTWRNTDLSKEFTASDTGSGLASASPIALDANSKFTLTASDETASANAFTTVSNTVTDKVGHAVLRSLSAKIDLTAPTVGTASAVKGAAPNFTGATNYLADTWTNKDVLVSWTCTDGLSGPVNANGSQSVTAEGANGSVTPSCADNVGHTANGTAFSPIKIDKSAPTNVAFDGGPAAGVSYDPDSVPPPPTCTANGDISGLASCDVSGYSANVGNHTMTATATDNAGNVATATRSYSVLGWTLSGFYHPVDMTITNTAKAGQTVPLKFEMFEKVSGDELTNVSAVKTYTQKVTCGQFTPTEDAIEEYSSGSTSLRHDGSQFIFNWQTPKSGAGSCFKVTMSPNDTSSNAIVANFKLR